MATEIATAYVSLLPSFKGGVSSISQQLGGPAAQAGADAGGKAGKGFGLGFGKMLAVGGATVGVGILVDKLGDFAAQGMESLAVGRTTEQVIKATGGAAQVSAAQVGALADSLSTKTGIDDEAIQSASNLLLTFKNLKNAGEGQAAMFDRATAASLDLSKTGFGDSASAANMLGKALNDPAKGMMALSRAGVTFSQEQKDQVKALMEKNQVLEAQNLIMSEVEGQVGGVAEATRSPLEAMQTTLGNLAEGIGKGLLPAIDSISKTLGPFVSKLSGPLGELAAGLGGALSSALSSLAPVLPPLAEALGAIARLLGSALTTAISALVPLVQPLLGILSELAQRVAPILEAVLAKVGQVLGRVFAAVLPLLGPLTDLVFTILDAAWPIIEVVADVLIILVDAIAPLLGIVGSLLPVLGQLINVLFAAILPILKPVLPLITTLADLLGNILARAMGITITEVGGLIVAFSKLAPFVLNNVTVPVIGFFLTMAEQIVGAAATAFSWIPGLGDKLEGAQKAIGQFKTDATKAIGDAAKTISKEGESIGRGLIDQGVALVTDPAQVNKAKSAGMGVGNALADGMRVGIANGQVPIQAAAASNVDAAATAARKAGDIHSPSRVFADIGTQLSEGLIQGVREGGKDVRKAMQESFTKWFDDTVQKLKDKLADAKQAFDDFRSTVSQAITGGLSFGDALSGGQDRQQAIDDAQRAYSDAVTAAAGPNATDADRRAVVDAQAQLDAARAQGSALGTSFMASLNAQAEQARVFAAKVRELISAGLSREALTQVLQSGVTAGTQIAGELLAGGADTINQANTLVTATQAAGDEVGLLAAKNFEGAGVASAQATVDGFRAMFGKDGEGRARLMRVMDNLARAAERDVKINVEVTRNVTERIERIMSSISGSSPDGARASGGLASRGTYLVGEKGPEILSMSTGGYVTANDDLRRLLDVPVPDYAAGAFQPQVFVRIGERELEDVVVTVVDDRDRVSSNLAAAGAW